MSIIYCEDEQAFLFHFVAGGTIAEVSCCCCCRGLYDNAARMDTSALQYELGPPRSRSPVVCVCVVHLLGPHPFFSLSSLLLLLHLRLCSRCSSLRRKKGRKLIILVRDFTSVAIAVGLVLIFQG